MEKHFELSDAEFEQKFITCELNPSHFSHEAHLRLAWIHIDNYGIEQAEKNIPYQLQKFVNHVGAKGKFNMTLTLAAVKAVYHFMLKSNSNNFKDFIAEFPRLKYNFKELMGHHYGFDIYHSNLAKTAFLEPDLIPFD
ncbi:hypothetical protein L0P88_01930 [Muricauda sp. SCSIO 64092]|uniref:hypothetical protein n=1 Tax=Allomuricauda sp. SCSIO 64092 TaxID=2908842 RepID=UPI001FF33375|nr:hypothetical protein [Muricauda sp. SCSIO 64092]UOY07325.1 hypothetical protein L0P88_01930 [Muricauda sp. SCSIO 64092]